ncbi:hypothetical protein LTR08_008720 [Meristemomyces frigidus]|nr:hypothetical protein LTR08_008720 [Meristemomyces frigidus]
MAAHSQWLFTPAELANTPSIQDGMTVSDERETRSKGIAFILQVGVLLKLPQLTLDTAAVFFQRFLMRASLKKPRGDVPKLHHYQSAATSLFLATKVEESGRKMKDLIVAFCRVAQKNPNLVVDEQSKDYWRWRDCLLHNEDVLLETLCFDLTVASPHRALFDTLKLYALEHHKRLRNAAWAFVTDSNSTQLCLLVSTRTIAVASLYAACRYCDVALPDDARGRPWWEAQGVRLKDVRRAVEHMCASYETAAGKGGVNGNANGNGAVTAAGGEDGAKSIYVGLSTPAPGLDGSVEGWDSTRLREEAPRGAGSPFISLPPLAGSERRLSNASSVALKREREEEEPPSPTNGVHAAPANGRDVDAGYKESKRARVGDQGAPNISATASGTAGGGEHDAKRAEEASRVEHGNSMGEADVEAARINAVAGKADGDGPGPVATGKAEPEPGVDEGSEEGEVEE